MRILYAIQGTGNGHVCRAREIVPILSRKAEVDVLISGIQADVQLPFPVKYTFNGLSYIFGKKGGIDLLETYKKSRIMNLLGEIKKLPVEDYDMVISDFEPVSSWACYFKNKPCIAMSHQAAVLSRNSPHPKYADPVGRAVLKVYAPSSVQYGFHFSPYDDNIYTPVIRSEIREAIPTDMDHYTVYLPAYSDKRIIKMLGGFEGVRWEIFSKHFDQKIKSGNMETFPVSSDEFIRSMVSSKGVICGAGFETPAEALFLNKKLLVIPMKNQYEQHCNAAALKELGVPVIKSLKRKHLPLIEEWLQSDERVIIDYPDNTENIIDQILCTNHSELSPDCTELHDEFDIKRFRHLTIRHIISKLGT